MLSFNLVQSWIAAAGLAAMAPWIPWQAIPPGVWSALAWTAPAHALYLFRMSRAFERGDLSLVYPITRSTPAFLPLVAVPLFGELLDPIGVLGIAIVMAWIWLVHLRPDLRRESFTGPATRFAYLTLLATIAYSLADKSAMASFAASEWPSFLPRSLVYLLLVEIGHAALVTPFVLSARGSAAVRAVFAHALGRATGAAAISVVGYALILRALETSLVSYVVAVRQSSVLFAVALGAFWLRERPGRPRAIGACATVVGVALIAWF